MCNIHSRDSTSILGSIESVIFLHKYKYKWMRIFWKASPVIMHYFRFSSQRATVDQRRCATHMHTNNRTIVCSCNRIKTYAHTHTLIYLNKPKLNQKKNIRKYSIKLIYTGNESILMKRLMFRVFVLWYLLWLSAHITTRTNSSNCRMVSSFFSQVFGVFTQTNHQMGLNLIEVLFVYIFKERLQIVAHSSSIRSSKTSRLQ